MYLPEKRDGLGFYHQLGVQPDATRECLKSLREIYPDSPVYLSTDGMQNYAEFHEIALEHNCEIMCNRTPLGYPPYDAYSVRRWMNRLLSGMLRLGTSHVAMIEDDILFNREMHYLEELDCLGHVIPHGNKIPEVVLNDIEKFSGKRPNADYYGAGGGSIFGTKVFIENYWNVTNHLINNWEFYKSNYWPQVGYADCYMVLFYMLCGKDFYQNPNLFNFDPHNPIQNHISKNSPPSLVKQNFGEHAWIHNYKFHYR